MSGIYQHRRVDIVPGEKAGSFKMVLVEDDVASIFCGPVFADVCERYIACYEDTGLRQSLGACYGRIGVSARNPILAALERMGHEEMAAWRRWVTWRGMMSSAQAAVVDDVLLHGRAPSNVRLLREGLRRLASRMA